MSEQERAELDSLLLTTPETFSEFYRRSISPRWGVPRHIEYLCSVVDRLVSGEFQKVILNVPPGHAKSTTITHRLPVYWGMRRPSTASLLTGYSQTFANKGLSRFARDVAQEMGLLGEASAMEEWHLVNGSRVVARGVGNPPTGINPIELIVIDDPIDGVESAMSEAQRQNVIDWFNGSIRQRFWPETRALVIATRWHERDLPGHLLSQDDGWVHINLKAIAEEDDPLGRKPGEALWPDAKPIEFLEAERAKNPFWFEALYQGNPSPREGDFFKPGSLNFCHRNDIDQNWSSVVALDLGYSESGDFTALAQGWKGPDNRFYLDIKRIRKELDERNQWIDRECRARKARVLIPQDGGSGKDVVKALTRLLAGLTCVAKPVSRSKELRASPLASQINAGNVYLIDSPEAREFAEECRVFPKGKNDDMIDAAADAYNDLFQSGWAQNLGELRELLA